MLMLVVGYLTAFLLGGLRVSAATAHPRNAHQPCSAVAGWSLQRSNIMYSRTTDFEHLSDGLEDSYEHAVSLATNIYNEANTTHIVAKQLQFALELDHNAPSDVKTTVTKTYAETCHNIQISHHPSFCLWLQFAFLIIERKKHH